MIDEKNCGCNFRVSNCKKCKKDYCNHYKSVSPFLCCYCVQDILKEYLNNTDRDCVNLDNNGYYCVQDILKEYLNNTDFNLDNDEYFNNILDSEINGQYKQMRETKEEFKTCLLGMSLKIKENYEKSGFKTDYFPRHEVLK